MSVVVFNIGSSTAKFAAYAAADSPAVARGQVVRGAICRLQATVGEAREETEWPLKDGHWLPGFLDWLAARFPDLEVRAAGHRLVHGGGTFVAPTEIDDGRLEALRDLSALAPLHMPPALEVMDVLRQWRADWRQIACFDTAFHATIPQSRRRFAIPRSYADEGVVRYGFHGLSYEHVAEQLARAWPAERAAGRVVALHLGNGASACGMVGGRSMATTMGLTALDGLVMGTRCGAIDAGVIFHLMRRYGMDVDAVEALLSKQSGLLGVSGVSADVRALKASDSEFAGEALELFCDSAARHVAALSCDIGGLDALVFTGGIGENNPDIRANIVARLRFLGLTLDAETNRSAGGGAAPADIGGDDSAAMIAVVLADEERLIARRTFEALAA